METLTVGPLFFLTGLYPLKYSKTDKKYKICVFRAIFCTSLILTLLAFNVHRVLWNICNLKALFRGESQTHIDRMGHVIRKVDTLSWICMHDISMIVILIQTKRICKLMNCMNIAVTDLIKADIVREHNSFDKKIRCEVFIILLWVFTAVFYGLRWTKPDSMEICLVMWIFGLHFPIIQMYELVFIEKIRWYMKILTKKFHSCNHKKFHKWLTLRQKLWHLSLSISETFEVMEVANLLTVVVVLAAYWFYNYGNFMNFCASFAWQLTLLPSFALCRVWAKLDWEVSHIFN